MRRGEGARDLVERAQDGLRGEAAAVAVEGGEEPAAAGGVLDGHGNDRSSVASVVPVSVAKSRARARNARARRRRRARRRAAARGGVRGGARRRAAARGGARRHAWLRIHSASFKSSSTDIRIG